MVAQRLGHLCRSLFWRFTMRRFMICCRAMAAEDLGLDGQRAMAPILRERWGRAWGRGEDSPGGSANVVVEGTTMNLGLCDNAGTPISISQSTVYMYLLLEKASAFWVQFYLLSALDLMSSQSEFFYLAMEVVLSLEKLANESCSTCTVLRHSQWVSILPAMEVALSLEKLANESCSTCIVAEKNKDVQLTDLLKLSFWLSR
ncbi:hypothetical protein EV1_009583 [Malus domestica]